MQTARSVRVCITFARWGFPIVREGYFLGGCHDKDFNIFGSILESADFGTLRNEFCVMLGLICCFGPNSCAILPGQTDVL